MDSYSLMQDSNVTVVVQSPADIIVDWTSIIIGSAETLDSRSPLASFGPSRTTQQGFTVKTISFGTMITLAMLINPGM
jgi:hypothetical protein